MKKLSYLFISMMILGAVASCSKGGDDTDGGTTPPPAAQEVDFELNASLKTSSAFSLEMPADAAISVFHVENNKTSYSNDGIFAADGGKFKGTIPAALVDAKKYKWFACWPASDKSTSPAKVYVTIPDEQTQDGYDNTGHIAALSPYVGSTAAIGARQTPEIELEPVAAILQVSITNVDKPAFTVRSVKLETAETELAGDFSVSLVATSLSAKVVDAVKSVLLTVNNGTSVAASQTATFNFAVRPCTIMAGDRAATVVITTTDGEQIRKTVKLEDSKTFKAGKTVELAALMHSSTAVVDAELSVARASIIAKEAAYDYTIGVTSNTSWIATSNADWAEVKTPNGSGDGSVVVSLTDCTGSLNGRDAIITVKSGDGAVTKRVAISQGYGVLFGNIMWAKFDVATPGMFTNKMDQAGNLYIVNSKVNFPACNVESPAPEGYPTGEVNLTVTMWEEANNPCPQGWRVPTQKEAQELIGWDIADNVSGVGLTPTSKKYQWWWYDNTQGAFIGREGLLDVDKTQLKAQVTATENNCIFIPMTGKRNPMDGTMTYTGSTFIQTAEIQEVYGGQSGNIHYQVHWDNALFGYGGAVNEARPVRCVTNFYE